MRRFEDDRSGAYDDCKSGVFADVRDALAKRRVVRPGDAIRDADEKFPHQNGFSARSSLEGGIYGSLRDGRGLFDDYGFGEDAMLPSDDVESFLVADRLGVNPHSLSIVDADRLALAERYPDLDDPQFVLDEIRFLANGAGALTPHDLPDEMLEGPIDEDKLIFGEK